MWQRAKMWTTINMYFSFQVVVIYLQFYCYSSGPKRKHLLEHKGPAQSGGYAALTLSDWSLREFLFEMSSKEPRQLAVTSSLWLTPRRKLFSIERTGPTFPPESHEWRRSVWKGLSLVCWTWSEFPRWRNRCARKGSDRRKHASAVADNVSTWGETFARSVRTQQQLGGG